MFQSKKQPAIKSLLAAEVVLTGHVQFQEGLRLDGKVHGDLIGVAQTASMLVISETATVEGTVAADHVIINGTVKGPVTARKMLELQPKAQVTGDVSYRVLEMHQGARVDGRLTPLLPEAAAEEKPVLKLAANNA